MSKNCLLTQYKVSVNNPDLPVLEDMQQFTLDAITRSGNDSMTDNQKWALNHFFYEIGAIGNTALWQKVRLLLIPLIGAAKNKIILDYKNTSVNIANSNDIVNQAGALEVTASSSIQVQNIDLTSPVSTFGSILVSLCPGSVLTPSDVPSGTLRTIGFTFNKANTSPIVRYARSISCSAGAISARNYDGTNSIQTISAASEMATAVVNYGASENKFDVLDGDGTFINTGTSTAEGTISSPITAGLYFLNLTPGAKVGVIADFSDSLTDDEMSKVIYAAQRLRASFA